MEMTEAAANKLKPFLKEEEGVRLAVQGGGCAGFEYKFGVVPLEDREEDDFTIEQLGVMMVVDPISYTYLESVTVDYEEDAFSSRFKINNPTVSRTCGCGNSFY
tara:strand:- start:167 stop:478 length:312 start_codon:yes stop_codon:yes gene_type:complete